MEGDLHELAAVPSFEAFYRDALDPVYRAVLVATRHPERAEDAVQEAFARALQRWDQVSGHDNPRAWVIRVALNHHRSGWRIWRRSIAPWATACRRCSSRAPILARKTGRSSVPPPIENFISRSIAA